MNRPKIFIACDTSKFNEVKKIIAQTKTNKLDICYKFGLEFFYTKKGREFISKVKGKKIFLDLKLEYYLKSQNDLIVKQILDQISQDDWSDNDLINYLNHFLISVTIY